MEPTKAMLKRLADVIDQDYDTIDDAAKAIMAEAWSLYEQRAQFIAIAATTYDPRLGGVTDPDAPFTDKVALGPYKSLTDAQKAAQGLRVDSRTGVQAAAFVLPYSTETPGAYYQRRKNEMASDGGQAKPWDAMVEEKQARLARQIEYYEKNPGVIGLPVDFDLEKRCYLCGNELKENER